MAENKPRHDVEMKGWLMKWTNYIKGYQKRWFVLSNGLLSYYRNQAEMAHTCRGTISLHGALIHTVDSCTFVISNGGTQTFHIKAANEVERQRWVTALELAKAKAIRAMESEDEEDVEYDQAHKREMENTIKTLNGKLEDLRTCNELINKHGSALQRSLSELESHDNAQDVATKMKAVNERATLFRISSNAMINACSEFLELAHSQGHKWQKMLQHEQHQRQRLEEIIEQLARQQNFLERAAQKSQMERSESTTSGEDDDEQTQFFDAETEESTAVSSTPAGKKTELVNIKPAQQVSSFIPQSSHTSSMMSPALLEKDSSSGRIFADVMKSLEETELRKSEHSGELRRAEQPSPSSSDVEEHDKVAAGLPQGKKRNILASFSKKSGKGKGTSVPSSESFKSKGTVAEPSTAASTSDATTPDLCHSLAKPGSRRTRIPDRPNCSLNLWSIMKNCIGKELSKIPMPVNFSEPLSMLQRLTEDYEYADLLDKAAECTDPSEQLAYLAAFTVSGYSSTSNRTGKPFNPLLGETYECDRRDDLGWRAISEQVSHHPPMVAQHCEGKNWTCWQEFTMTSKFRGKYLEVVPLGKAYCTFRNSPHYYSWRKVTTTVHNIIVGKLWLDQHGDMEIVDHYDNSVCNLRYYPYSYFTRDVQRKVSGHVKDHTGIQRYEIKGTWDGHIDIARVIAMEGSIDNTNYQTVNPRTVWKKKDLPPDSEKYYNFTLLACQLNEMEEGVAPTDSRLRPDQRLMEEGRWQEANQMKQELEEKQRIARRQRETTAEEAAFSGADYSPYKPVWFYRKSDPTTGGFVHSYSGGYWECKAKQDWSMCPDIF